MNKEYAIVMQSNNNYDKFTEYDYPSFVETLKRLTAANASFRAFRITPLEVSMVVTINEVAKL